MENSFNIIADKLSTLFERVQELSFVADEESKKRSFVASTCDPEIKNKLKKEFNCDVYNKSHGYEFYVGSDKVVIHTAKSNDFDFINDMNSFGINILIGKILKGSGVKLTQLGLIYEEKLNINNHNSKVGDFLITKNSKDIFSLFKLDYQIFKQGFDSRNEVFEFILTSPYIDINEFKFPKKEHKLRIFGEFQVYLTINNIEHSFSKLTFEHFDAHFSEIDFFHEIEQLKEKEERKRNMINGFNGRLILDYYPDFDKKVIGTAIYEFKNSFQGVDNFSNFIFESTLEDVMFKFKEVVKF